MLPAEKDENDKLSLAQFLEIAPPGKQITLNDDIPQKKDGAYLLRAPTISIYCKDDLCRRKMIFRPIKTPIEIDTMFGGPNMLVFVCSQSPSTKFMMSCKAFSA